jgi:hypothetical protein
VSDLTGFNILKTNIQMRFHQVADMQPDLNYINYGSSPTNYWVVFEAENYDMIDDGILGANTPRHWWAINTNVPAGSVNTPSGGSDMQGQPVLASTNPDDVTVYGIPRLDYGVNLPVSGTWYVWVRFNCEASTSRNSFAIGADFLRDYFGNRFGNDPAVGNLVSSWNWINNTYDANANALGNSPPLVAQLTNVVAGYHTFHVWMREDGTHVDKVVITTNSDGYLFSSSSGVGPGYYDFGPAVTRLPDISLPTVYLSAVRNLNGTITVSWNPTGGTLQWKPAAAVAGWTSLVGSNSPSTFSRDFFGTNTVFFQVKVQ